MVSIARVSRRALVATATLLAIGPAAEARKRGGRRKPKPLAFATITVTGVILTPPGQDPTGFIWRLKGEVALKDGRSFDLPGEATVPTGSTAEQTRAAIVRQTRDGAAFALGFIGVEIPPDRIQVTLL